LIFENIVADESSKDIVDVLYIPVFKKLVENKKNYNIFCYSLLQNTNINNNDVSKKAANMAKEIDKLYSQIVVPYLQTSISKGIEQPTKDISYIYDEDFRLIRFGKLNANQKREGVWTGIKDGAISTIATFKNDVLAGKTQEYTNNKLHYEYNLNGDNIDGEIIEYFPQEKEKDLKIKRIYSLSEGDYTGLLQKYNYSGILTEKSNWNNGLYDGKVELFYPQGSLSFEGIYKDGYIIGNSTEYFENGQIKGKYTLNNDGTISYTEYYSNGNIETQATLLDSLYIGNYITYYATGEKESEYFYNEVGYLQGKGYTYFKNGKLSSEASYNDGKKDGINVVYCISGKKSYSINYNKAKIQEVVTYNYDGTEKEHIKQKGDAFVFDVYFYDEDNISFKTATLSMNDDGEWQGRNYKYSPQGMIIAKYDYVNGNIDGNAYEYFPSGQISKYAQYTDGVHNGISMEYYSNGKIKNEAINQDENAKGAYYEYDTDEQLESMYLFDDNNEMLSSISYYKGNIFEEDRCKAGLLNKLYYYDETGKLFKSDSIIDGNGIVTHYFLNGKPNLEYKIVAGLVQDTLVVYGINGEIVASRVYKAGKLDGLYQDFDRVTNKLRYQTNYNAGLINGKAVFYEDEIKVYEDDYAENELINGISFFLNGNKSKVAHYESGEQLKIVTYYTPDGKTIRFKIKLYNDMCFAISYMNKDGEMSGYQMIEGRQSFKSYYPSGIVSCEINYENGLLDGNYNIYYPTGKLCSESKYEKDAIIFDKDFYENGNLYIEKNYKNDMLNGEVKYFYPNGNLKRLENYMLNNLDGEVKLFDINGNLIETQLWANDIRKN
jgi:antitoxin component YwqK of YwqJK toxin-antitoxin module